jgi:hypothetical protein
MIGSTGQEHHSARGAEVAVIGLSAGAPLLARAWWRKGMRLLCLLDRGAQELTAAQRDWFSGTLQPSSTGGSASVDWMQNQGRRDQEDAAWLAELSVARKAER